MNPVNPKELDLTDVYSSADWAATGVEQFHEECLKLGVFTKLKLPSGKKIIATRPPLAEWATFGFLPQDLTAAAEQLAMKATSKAQLEEKFKQMVLEDDSQFVRSARFAKNILEWAVVIPRIKIGARGPREIEPANVPTDDMLYILNWVKNGCPGVPVIMADGRQVSYESVASFRNESELPSDVPDGPGGREVRTVSKRGVGVSKRKRRGH
ncbi:MAG TPA: hypothetical protein VGO91_10765 [Pyrinomonadaceae bacterium]|jgi:hypothetical protein|nr:hypothetical protein [Pyrinomonadaceae bacterium]